MDLQLESVAKLQIQRAGEVGLGGMVEMNVMAQDPKL